MGTVFTTEKILTEIKRLDRITGLEGASLEIRKCRGKSRVAYFAFPREKKPYFAFSVTYFEDTEFPDAEKIATIEHEYAHFMDHKETGSTDHGDNWKSCCNKIRTSSERCLSKTKVDFYKAMEKQQEERQQLISSISDCLAPGTKITHPKFGEGTIVSLTGKTDNDVAVISFEKAGEKNIIVSWLYNNAF